MKFRILCGFGLLATTSLLMAEEQTPKAAAQSEAPMKREEIMERVLKSRAYEGERFFPQQTSRERTAELNRLLVERGFSPASVKIVDTSDGQGVFEWLKANEPTFAVLLKFSVGRTLLKCRISDGVIEIYRD